MNACGFNDLVKLNGIVACVGNVFAPFFCYGWLLWERRRYLFCFGDMCNYKFLVATIVKIELVLGWIVCVICEGLLGVLITMHVSFMYWYSYKYMVAWWTIFCFGWLLVCGWKVFNWLSSVVIFCGFDCCSDGVGLVYV